mgnify:FL=1
MGYVFHPDNDMRGKMLQDTRKGGTLWPWSKPLSDLPYMVLVGDEIKEDSNERPFQERGSIKVFATEETEEEIPSETQTGMAGEETGDKEKIRKVYGKSGK